MGNCQAVEAAAAAVIEHPGGRVERLYWSVAAHDVMAANPGHYVAAVVVAAPPSSASDKSSSPSPNGSAGGRAAAPVTHVKLLRPDDALQIGRAYRLVTFEDVLKVFGSRRYVKLSKLIVRQESKKKARLRERDGGGGNTSNESSSETKIEIEKQEDKILELESSASRDAMTTYKMSKYGLWKPTLQTIAEVES